MKKMPGMAHIRKSTQLRKQCTFLMGNSQPLLPLFWSLQKLTDNAFIIKFS